MRTDSRSRLRDARAHMRPARLALGILMSWGAVLHAQETHGDLRHLHGVVESAATGRPVRDAEVVVTWTAARAAGSTSARAATAR
ncbi:hypothetical protein, partial [Gemmatimonas sp.]|uniref:hypothetical protein n=1 Tax=Gemmatimonas sp. TaxID=1962908 RepID=UPI00391B19F7